jgi:hypothetical protein
MVRCKDALPTDTEFVVSATDPAPSATAFAALTVAFDPSATPPEALVAVPPRLIESFEFDVLVPPFGLNVNEFAEFVTVPPFGASNTLCVELESRTTKLLPITTELAASLVIWEPMEMASALLLTTEDPIATESFTLPALEPDPIAIAVPPEALPPSRLTAADALVAAPASVAAVSTTLATRPLRLPRVAACSDTATYAPKAPFLNDLYILFITATCSEFAIDLW